MSRTAPMWCTGTPRERSWAAAGLLHFATVWGGEQAVLPSLGVGSPTPQYGAKATATDVFHHVVYTTATSAAYEWLDRH